MPSLRALLLLALVGGSAVGCPRSLPPPPAECSADGRGCLPDEECVANRCALREKCSGDADCPSPAYRCAFPAQTCALREGFGEECSATLPCVPGQFCALGRCRDLATARPCARRTDCPVGQGCDRNAFFCIEEEACTLTDTFPELACDPTETCDTLSQRCRVQCQNECTPETAADDCGAARRCDNACRCVQCLTDTDCGVGLTCNTRAGRCESESLCFSDAECDAPLVCDPRTALCQVAPPPCEDNQDCQIAEVCNRTSGVCELPGGACVDDRLEENDTPAGAEAVELAPGAPAVVVDSLQLCPDDDDVYAVTLSAGDRLTVSATDTTPQARATLWLLDSGGERSLRFAEAPPRGNGTLTYEAQLDERVFLRVNALVGASPYGLTWSRAAGTPCLPDLFEGSGGNDTAATATPAAQVPVGARFDANLCPGDVDFFQVALAAGEAIEAALTFNGAQTDLDLDILDASTLEVLARSSGVQSPERARVRASTPRTVVVRVRGFGTLAGAYALELARSAPFVCAADALEPDAPTPTPVAVAASLPATERTLCIGDVDAYAVQLLDFERLVVHAAFDATDLDLGLTVLDATGAVVLARAPTTSSGRTVTYDARADETVIVRATALANTSAPYTIAVARENQVSCTPDESEPNDTPATPAAVPGASVLTLCGSEEDYFAIDGAAGKKLVVDTAFIHADADLDVQILGIDRAQILAVGDGIGDGEHVEAVLPVDGVYLIRVFALRGGARTRYSLSAALEAP